MGGWGQPGLKPSSALASLSPVSLLSCEGNQNPDDPGWRRGQRTRTFLLIPLPFRCPATSSRKHVWKTGVPLWSDRLGKVTLRPGRAGADQAGEGLIAGGLRSLSSASPLESLVLTPLEILKLGFQFNYILIKGNKGTGAPGTRLRECLMELQSCFFPVSHSLRGSELSPRRRPGLM